MTTPGNLPLETPEGLRKSLGDLIEESRALRRDVRADAAQRRRENLINLGLAVLLMIFIGVVGAIAWQNQQIGQQIADCTNVGGRCYEEGRGRTGAAIEELVRANVALHQCLETPGVDTEAELLACMERKLSRAPKTP